MTEHHGPEPPPTPITAKQIVVGAVAVLLLALGLTLYAEQQQPLDAAERVRREMTNTMIEACKRYDKSEETELNDACEFLLKDKNPL